MPCLSLTRRAAWAALAASALPMASAARILVDNPADLYSSPPVTP